METQQFCTQHISETTTSLTTPLTYLALLWMLLCASLSLAAGDTLEEARQHHLAGQWRQALDAYAEVATNGEPADAAIARNNACTIYNLLAEYSTALEQCQQALALRRTLDDERRLARTLNNLAVALQHLGRYDEATASYREALAINTHRSDFEAQAINHQNLGLVATAAGHYGPALESFGLAQALTEQHADEPWAARQNSLARFNRGVALEKVGAYREALALYRALVDEPDGLSASDEAAVLVNLGVIYRNLGDPVKAVLALQEATEAYDKLEDTAALSNTWLNLALAYHLNLNRLDDAEAAYRRALDLARASGDRSEEIQDLFYLGRLLLDTNRLQEAESIFETCLQVATDSGSAEGQWSALAGLGRAAALDGRSHQALEHLERAIDAIESVRAGIAAGALRSGYFGDKRPVYAQMIEILASLEAEESAAGYPQRALGVVQRVKSRELLDSLGGEHGPMTPATADQLIARLAEDAAGDGAVVLEYFVGEDNLFLWVIHADEIRMLALGPAQPILDKVSAAYALLSRAVSPPPELLESLANQLLPGLEGELAEATHLHIAPDAGLHYLPFEILQRPGSSQVLIDQLVISYLPSASALRPHLDSAPARQLMLAGFGAPSLPNQSTDSLAGRMAQRFELGPLPAATRELQAIERMLPGENLIRIAEQATEAALRDAATVGARVVHLATHTIVNGLPDQGAAILLSPDAEDDGLLRPAEIATFDYQVDLTVLAACRSALGAVEEGRAFASLTGSLLTAGSSGVIASLWDIGDEASATFMEQLYYQLGQGESPAEALRQAKLRLRADPAWNRPELWAAFILVGDAPPIVDRRTVPLWGWIVAGTVLLLLAAAVRRQRQRR